MTLDAGECGMEFEMNLPTPYLYAIYGEPAQNPRHSTRVEAETFWSADGNEKYRPRDREGNLIEIVYPDESEDLSDDDCPPHPIVNERGAGCASRRAGPGLCSHRLRLCPCHPH